MKFKIENLQLLQLILIICIIFNIQNINSQEIILDDLDGQSSCINDQCEQSNIIYDSIIIGGGLSGLSTAYTLQNSNKNLKILILEAKHTLGGRILSPDSLELGAAWTWDSENNLHNLMKELNVQKIPNNNSEYRIENGAQSIINKIQQILEKNENVEIRTNQIVTEIQNLENIKQIQVKLENNQIYFGKTTVLALPPKQILQRIKFNENLSLQKIKKMEETCTWMSDSMKISSYFQSNFWAGKGIQHPFYEITQNEQPALQLFIVGPQTQQFSQVYIKKWFEDEFVYSQNNNIESNYNKLGYNELRTPEYQQKLQFAGTETEKYHGHMEGAVKSGKRVSQNILKYLKENDN